jgi:linker histone H1 and H5 family
MSYLGHSAGDGRRLGRLTSRHWSSMHSLHGSRNCTDYLGLREIVLQTKFKNFHTGEKAGNSNLSRGNRVQKQRKSTFFVAHNQQNRLTTKASVSNSFSVESLQEKNHEKMATIGMIKEAIVALKERDGSSVQAITKWIESEKNVSVKNSIILCQFWTRSFSHPS